MHRGFELLVSMGLVVGCCFLAPLAHAEAPATDLTISAIAPLGLSEQDLGRPHSARFEPLIGKEARSVFPAAKAARKIPISAWQHKMLWIQSGLELEANARALSFSGSVGATSTSRTAVFRAVQLTHAIEVDDTTDPRPVGVDGAFYVRRISFGRVNDVVISGNQDTFTAGVRAELLAYGGSVSVAAKKYNLHTEISARGLKPKAEAVFARTEEEIRAAYVEDPSYNAGKPVPVMVEYRRVPGSTVEEDQPIEWVEGTPTLAARTSVRVVRVAGANSAWSDTGLVAAEGDVVIGHATGKVTFGWGADSQPDTPGTGGLDMMVGPTTVPAGKSWVAVVDKPGRIMLRVRDNKHSDNKGEFVAAVMMIPRAALGEIDCAITDPANGQKTADCSETSP